MTNDIKRRPYEILLSFSYCTLSLLHWTELLRRITYSVYLWYGLSKSVHGRLSFSPLRIEIVIRSISLNLPPKLWRNEKTSQFCKRPLMATNGALCTHLSQSHYSICINGISNNENLSLEMETAFYLFCTAFL